jgi:Rieske 2Fe-2S family protein
MHLEPTLPREYYCGYDVFEREMEKIFDRSWLCAGRDSRIPAPGDYFTLRIGRESVLVLRDREMRPRAFHNVCRHRGARLCPAEQGRLKGAICCPYHSWTYSLDGRLIATPHLRSEGGFPREDFSLHPVALESWGGFLFLNLQGVRAAPLAEQLGAVPERTRRYPLSTLKTGALQVDEVQANWKILIENYMECYHCPGIHPELCDLVPLYRKGEVDPAGGEAIAYFREGAVTFSATGTTRRPLLTGLDEEERRKYSGELIYPAMMLNLFPDYVHARTLWPLGPERTRIVSEWLFEPGTMAADGFDAADAVEFLNLVSRQDWDVCEAVQEGVASRAQAHGVYVPQEAPAADFKRWVLERLESS